MPANQIGTFVRGHGPRQSLPRTAPPPQPQCKPPIPRLQRKTHRGYDPLLQKTRPTYRSRPVGAGHAREPNQHLCTSATLSNPNPVMQTTAHHTSHLLFSCSSLYSMCLD